MLNLGNNQLKEFPEALSSLTSLEKLHLFGNGIQTIDTKVLGK